jgi:hypothetical protein
LKSLTILGRLLCVLLPAAMGDSQALTTASAKGSLQLGTGFTYARPDYGQFAIQGISGFADFDFGAHVGVEADFHSISLITPNDLAEDTFLVGPRFILPHGRFKFYGKALAGEGDLVIQQQADNVGRQDGYFFAYAVGGGVDVLATHHLVVRAVDFEYQHWNYLTGLTPVVVTVGAAYRFH